MKNKLIQTATVLTFATLESLDVGRRVEVGSEFASTLESMPARAQAARG